MARNIPFLEEDFYQAYKLSSFLWLDINNLVNVTLHMGTDVSDLPEGIYGIPKRRLYLASKRNNLLCQGIF